MFTNCFGSRMFHEHGGCQILEKSELRNLPGMNLLKYSGWVGEDSLEICLNKQRLSWVEFIQSYCFFALDCRENLLSTRHHEQRGSLLCLFFRLKPVFLKSFFSILKKKNQFRNPRQQPVIGQPWLLGPPWLLPLWAWWGHVNFKKKVKNFKTIPKSLWFHAVSENWNKRGGVGVPNECADSAFTDTSLCSQVDLTWVHSIPFIMLSHAQNWPFRLWVPMQK